MNALATLLQPSIPFPFGLGAMSPAEAIAFLLGLANVGLLVRRSIWNYPAGLAMVAIYGFVFFEAKLYSDALLQLFFFAVQIYGWVNWAHSKAEAGEVKVELLRPATRLVLAAASGVAILG